MPHFVKSQNNEQTCIQFHCSECKKQFITTIDDFGKSFICPKCDVRVTTLPIFCQHPGCLGRYSYFRCGGTIRKITGEELAAEEKKALESAQDLTVGATASGSFHDDASDIRGSVVTYKCDKCGDSFTLTQAVSMGIDSGNEKCERIVCDTCGRHPIETGLPEPDPGIDNSPLKIIN